MLNPKSCCAHMKLSQKHFGSIFFVTIDLRSQKKRSNKSKVRQNFGPNKKFAMQIYPFRYLSKCVSSIKNIYQIQKCLDLIPGKAFLEMFQIKKYLNNLSGVGVKPIWECCLGIFCDVSPKQSR